MKGCRGTRSKTHHCTRPLVTSRRYFRFRRETAAPRGRAPLFLDEGPLTRSARSARLRPNLFYSTPIASSPIAALKIAQASRESRESGSSLPPPLDSRRDAVELVLRKISASPEVIGFCRKFLPPVSLALSLPPRLGQVSVRHAVVLKQT